ncbi:hypothetical protein MTR67_024911 [Solanum verrucosum]|uniref:DUF4219 domain-containing protein n=1 Tax=Solanum verrucosum TaxID=315347 RepID=A0AAF0R402_SOLVR|nr:hypothetical protein MTR67_024911 [Solanum verrucosum]
MAVPLNLEEGQSSTRPPRFNSQFYSCWKIRMHDYLIVEDSELWDIVLDGPHIPTMDVKEGEIIRVVPKTRQSIMRLTGRRSRRTTRLKNCWSCTIGAEEYNRISSCESTKDIRNCLKTAHEGTEQVKESKVHMLTTQYKNFLMK